MGRETQQREKKKEAQKVQEIYRLRYKLDA